MEAQIFKFLNEYGYRDHPTLVDLLIDDHFYYIDSDLQGWFVPENISIFYSPEEKLVHKYLKENKEQCYQKK